MTTRRQDENFIGDVIGLGLLDSSIEWIAKNLEPEEVFDSIRLDEWAEANGYVKEAV